METLTIPRTPQFDKDLAVLTEMATVEGTEAVHRAVHLAAELMAHQRDGGTVMLVPRRFFGRWERLRFRF